MSAYVIAIIDVQDPAGYESYRELAPATVERYGGRFLARGGRYEVLEGEGTGNRYALLEFETYERAQEWWNSSEYAVAKTHRLQTAISSFVLTEGLQ